MRSTFSRPPDEVEIVPPVELLRARAVLARPPGAEVANRHVRAAAGAAAAGAVAAGVAEAGQELQAGRRDTELQVEVEVQGVAPVPQPAVQAAATLMRRTTRAAAAVVVAATLGAGLAAPAALEPAQRLLASVTERFGRPDVPEASPAEPAQLEAAAPAPSTNSRLSGSGRPAGPSPVAAPASPGGKSTTTTTAVEQAQVPSTTVPLATAPVDGAEPLAGPEDCPAGDGSGSSDGSGGSTDGVSGGEQGSTEPTTTTTAPPSPTTTEPPGSTTTTTPPTTTTTAPADPNSGDPAAGCEPAEQPVEDAAGEQVSTNGTSPSLPGVLPGQGHATVAGGGSS